MVSWKLNPDKAKDPKSVSSYKERFWRAMSEDLNTPVALSIVWELAKDTQLSNVEKLALMEDFDLVLGFGVKDFSRPELKKEDLALIEERERARKEKDYKKSDELRDELSRRGIMVKDSKNSTDWYLSL